MLVILLILSLFMPSQHDTEFKDYTIRKVNNLRAKGCNCGGEFMPPVGKVKWNDKLFQSSLIHAKDMHAHNYFGHFNRRGEDIGKRIAKTGYDWAVVGENLGEGQKTFDQVFRDWIKSTSHCRMLMNPKVNEMAVAKYRKYWVQHFGKEHQ